MIKPKLIVGMIAILWIGMILAIGMESVVKFQTPTLTKPVAFDVGRTVFGAFNKVQCILFFLLIAAGMFAKLAKLDQAFILILAITLLLQISWLFPALSQRVDMILSGTTPPSTYKHALYGLLEMTKLLVLSVIAFRMIF